MTASERIADIGRWLDELETGIDDAESNTAQILSTLSDFAEQGLRSLIENLREVEESVKELEEENQKLLERIDSFANQ